MLFSGWDTDQLADALSPTLATCHYLVYVIFVPLNDQIALMGGSYERVENERTNAMRRQRAELLLQLGAPRVGDIGCKRLLLLSRSGRL